MIWKSTDADLHAIRHWLKAEHTAGVEDNFLCNWEIIEKCHREGKLLVYIDLGSGVPVGFQLGALLSPGILQVRKDMRRRGIARKLVEHRIAEAYEKDEPFLFIECKPPSSIPFWKKMGFTLLQNDDGKNLAYRVLEKRHELPSDGRPIHVEIRFYRESRMRNPSIAPCKTAVPTAVWASDGTVYLSERISFFSRIYPDMGDAVVEIFVNGELRYLDKAKRPRGEQIGVNRCWNGFFIDEIYRGALSQEV